MAILSDNRNRTAAFLHSEASGQGYRSRESATVVNGSADPYPAGTVLGRVTADGTYVRHDTGLVNGAENAAGVLYEEVPAGETASRTIIVRDAELNGHFVTYAAGADAAAIAATDDVLAGRGIIVRR